MHKEKRLSFLKTHTHVCEKIHNPKGLAVFLKLSVCTGNFFYSREFPEKKIGISLKGCRNSRKFSKFGTTHKNHIILSSLSKKSDFLFFFFNKNLFKSEKRNFSLNSKLDFLQIFWKIICQISYRISQNNIFCRI